MLNTLGIRPGLISTLNTCSDNQGAVPQLHFLASWTSFGMKCKSTRVFKKKPKVKIMLEINIKQIMVMLDLLNKSRPCQQLLWVA